MEPLPGDLTPLAQNALKRLLRQRALPVAGSNADLRARLTAWRLAAVVPAVLAAVAPATPDATPEALVEEHAAVALVPVAPADLAPVPIVGLVEPPIIIAAFPQPHIAAPAQPVAVPAAHTQMEEFRLFSAAAAAERRRERDEDRDERRRMREEEREERDFEAQRRDRGEKTLFVSEGAEKLRAWDLMRSDLVGTFLQPVPSPDLVHFIRNFYSLQLQDEELVKRFALATALYPTLHAHLLATNTIFTPPNTPLHLLSDVHTYLGNMGALFYFHEYKESAHEGGKKVGGLAKALLCPTSLLREDLNIVRKQEGSDAISRLYRAELLSQKPRSFTSHPTQQTVFTPPTSQAFCQKCFTLTGKKFNNHTALECRRLAPPPPTQNVSFPLPTPLPHG